MIRPPAWIVTHGAALILGAAASWWFTDLAANAAASKLAAAAEHERAEAFRWVASEQKRSAAAMAVEDARATGEIKHAQEQTDRLLDCIDRGAGCGLRIKVARNPTKCGAVPEAGAAPSVGSGSGEWAELDEESQQAYFALRERLPIVEQALKVCVSQWLSR